MVENNMEIEIPDEMRRDHALYGLLPGPIWPDDCEHGGYVCSFEDLYVDKDKKLVQENFDLYVFENPLGQQVCLRFGRDSDYYSVGSVVELAKTARHMSCYMRALELLLKFGKIEWTRNKE